MSEQVQTMPENQNETNQTQAENQELKAALESVQRLEATLKKVNEKNRSLEKLADSVSRIGGLDEILKIRESHEKAEEQRLQAEGKHKELFAIKEKAWAEESARLKAELERERAEKLNFRRDHELQSAFLRHGVLDTHADFLKHELSKRISVDPSGNFSILDQYGSQAHKVDGANVVPMSIDDLIAETKADKRWGVAFRATVASGTGSHAGTGHAPTTSKNALQAEWDEIAEKMKAGKGSRQDEQALTRLMVQAQQQGITLKTI